MSKKIKVVAATTEPRGRVVTERMPPYAYQDSPVRSMRISFETKNGPDPHDQERLREALQNLAFS